MLIEKLRQIAFNRRFARFQFQKDLFYLECDGNGRILTLSIDGSAPPGLADFLNESFKKIEGDIVKQINEVK